MGISRIDDNFTKTAIASDGVTGIEPLRVDPVTSRLLIDVEVTTSTTPATLESKRDDNFVPVSYAVTDDASENLTPLIIDNRSGYLFVDFNLE